MKRLLIVVPVYASYRAFLKGLAAWLVERGWEVHVATNTEGFQLENDAATVHQLSSPRGANPLQLFKAGRALTRLIREIQPTVVHAHFSVGMLVLALAQRIPGVRYLGTFQGMRFPLITGFRRWVFKLVECFSILRLNKSWVLTSDDYEAVPRFARKKLAIQEGYGFGCDIGHFDPERFMNADKSNLRSELGIPEEAFVFIFVGRVTAFKGFPLALQAFRQLRQERSDVHFLVVGEPDPVHPINLPDLKTLPGVHHVGWQDDPAPYLAISDAMVFPSQREGMPVCMMEALAMGVPVVTTNSRGCRELVINENSGLIVERCAGSIRLEMKQMLSKPDLCNGLSLNALRMREQLDRRHFYDVVEKTLRLIGEDSN